MSKRLGFTVDLKQLPPDAHPQKDEVKELVRKKAIDQKQIEPKRVFG